MSFFSPKSPAPQAAAPPPPVADPVNTSKAVTAQATAQTGRASNIVAGEGPSLDDSIDPYSVRKKLIGS